MAWIETHFEEPERISFATFAVIGDKVEGVYRGTIERENNFGRREIHVLIQVGNDADGIPEVSSIRTNQRLLAQFASVKKGQRVRVEYVRDQENDGVDRTGQPLKPSRIFSVMVDDGKPGAAPPAGEPSTGEPDPF